VFMDFITDQTENVYPMVPGARDLGDDPGGRLVSQRHIISILVENERGRCRASRGCSRRAPNNIESLTVRPPRTRRCRA